MKRYTTDIDNCRSCPNCYWDSGVYMCDSLDIALNAGNTEPKGFDMDTQIHPDCILPDTNPDQ